MFENSQKKLYFYNVWILAIVVNGVVYFDQLLGAGQNIFSAIFQPFLFITKLFQ